MSPSIVQDDTEFTKQMDFRKHVMHDFEPYFCTVEECQAPFDVPNSFVGLLDHLQSHLQVIYHIDTSAGDHKEYSEEEFERHVVSLEDVPDETIAMMKAAHRGRGAYLFDTCPFCGGYPDTVETIFPESETMEAQEALRRHIKNHLQQIALFFPPDRPDLLEKDYEPANSDVTRRRSNVEGVTEDLEDFKYICEDEKCTCRDGRMPAEEDMFPHTTYATEERWMCCRCRNDYSSAFKDRCTHCGDRQKRDNEYCYTYVRDCTLEGDWSRLLDDSALYNRSDITDEELRADERLLPFILRSGELDLPADGEVETDIDLASDIQLDLSGDIQSPHTQASEPSTSRVPVAPSIAGSQVESLGEQDDTTRIAMQTTTTTNSTSAQMEAKEVSKDDSTHARPQVVPIPMSESSSDLEKSSNSAHIVETDIDIQQTREALDDQYNRYYRQRFDRASGEMSLETLVKSSSG